MTNRELYSPDQIAEHLLASPLVPHGVNPAAGEQNVKLISTLQSTARDIGGTILGISVIGSRANGTHVETSDADLIVITRGSRTDTEAAKQQLVESVQDAHDIEVDPTRVGRFLNVPDVVPTNPSEFIDWAREYPEISAGLFNNGVYSHPSLLVYQLAGAYVLTQEETEGESLIKWEATREHHSHVFLSQLDRIRMKLVERLGRENAEGIGLFIDNSLMKERRRRFALPRFPWDILKHLQEEYAARAHTQDDEDTLYAILRELDVVGEIPYNAENALTRAA